MTTDLYSTVLYNDGEGLSLDDLNNAQGFAGSRLFDQIIGKCVSGDLSLGANSDPEFSAQFNSAHAYWAIALSVGGGMPRQGSANNKVLIGKGTILQCLGVDTGTEPVFVAFTFDGTAEFTVPNGNATNPRMDLLQVKLEYVTGGSESRDFQDAVTRALTTSAANKRRRIQATVSFKSGTAAATPQIPDCDAGFCALALVFTPALYTGAGAFGDNTFGTPAGGAELMDMRVPVRVRPHTVRAKDGLYDPAIWISKSGSATPYLAQIRSLKCNTSTPGPDSNLIILCPVTKGRVVGVAIACANGTAPSIANLGVLAEPDGFAVNVDISAALETGATMKYHLAGLSLIDAQTGIARSAVQGLGPPIWATGGGRPIEWFRIGSGVTPHFSGLCLSLAPHSTMEIAVVTFYIAEGW